MRVNVDSSVVTDPRFKLLGRALGVTWREALGSCLLVWFACYDRRSEQMTAEEIDVTAEREAFASALVSVGLAHVEATEEAGRDTVVVHGVTERIHFLQDQKRRGAIGGKKSGKSRQAKAVMIEATPEASGEANASGVAQANPLALDLPLALALAPPLSPPLPPKGGDGGDGTRKKRKPPEPAKPRPRNLLFDAVADVTGLDPSTAGPRIAAAAAKLAKAGPPYTPEDVRAFADRFWDFCPWAQKDGRNRPTPNELSDSIGLLRSGPGPQQPGGDKPAAGRAGGRTDPAAQILNQVAEAIQAAQAAADAGGAVE